MNVFHIKSLIENERKVRLYMLLMVFLQGACGLSLEEITPNVGEAFTAQQVEVLGNGLSLETQFSLFTTGVNVSCATLSVNDDGTSAKIAVPAAAPAGIYDLRAKNDGTEVWLKSSFTLVEDYARIRFVDVGQGDATLLEMPSGEIVLVDGGKVAKGDVLKAEIEDFSGGRLDFAIASHFDEDHLGGWIEVLMGDDGIPGTADDLKIPRFSQTDTLSCETQLCDRMRMLVPRVKTPLVGQRIVESGVGEEPFSLEVVAVDGNTAAGKVEGADDTNENSIVLLFRYGGRSVLINGDLTGGGRGSANVEEPLSEITGVVDVLRTGHHGSRTSSNANALANWSPLLAVISVGTDNAFCHPDNEVLQRISENAAKVWMTGKGVVEATDRCERTEIPQNARAGLGDIDLEIFASGRLEANGEAL